MLVPVLPLVLVLGRVLELENEIVRPPMLQLQLQFQLQLVFVIVLGNVSINLLSLLLLLLLALVSVSVSGLQLSNVPPVPELARLLEPGANPGRDHEHSFPPPE